MVMLWKGPSALTLYNGIIAISICVHAKLLCLTLCNPMDCSLPGSSVDEILQASGLPFPSPGDLPDSGIEPGSHVSCIGR